MTGRVAEMTASSIKRLSSLPAIFTANDLLRLTGAPVSQINQMAWRWKTAGLIEPLGSRSEVWFNLVVDRKMTRERWEVAVRMALPLAISAGHTVLMKSGLSTQMTSLEYMIRPPRSAVASIKDVELYERPALWIRKLRSMGAVKCESGLPVLDPGAALADLIVFDAQAVDLNEIDLEELEPDSLQMYEDLCSIAGIKQGESRRDRQRTRFVVASG